MTLHDDALLIARRAIDAAMPDAAVRRALAAHRDFLNAPGRLILVAVGKAAWTMARAAWDEAAFDGGVIVTARGCAHGPVGNAAIIEAGHPIPDEMSILGAETALERVRGLTEHDRVLFLLSGGGSALFEKPLIAPDELARITEHLLRSGADIVAINTIRKRLSAVKGGRFALACRPARVLSLVLSDVLGDPLDMIASGPAAPDTSTSREALALAGRYALPLSDAARACLARETPKALDNVESEIIGSVSLLCASAADTARALGYEPLLLTDRLDCEAREAGAFLAAMAKTHAGRGRRAFILGGETVVHVRGRGLGGRNQELALAAAGGLNGLNAALMSVGSDGRDGPTDAAGGCVDGASLERCRAAGVDIAAALADNDAYHALDRIGALIRTGPTGTNVGDLTVLLIGG
ncbi:MAG: DUF4147 domain-containing protein [Clostridiales bacterium]|nr:DUF4147 domain-containing protein [Clostridiales bacterium]MDY2873084.1 DUF4147 domain-containing protein [Eubacteriales bacterium]